MLLNTDRDTLVSLAIKFIQTEGEGLILNYLTLPYRVTAILEDYGNLLNISQTTQKRFEKQSDWNRAIHLASHSTRCAYIFVAIMRILHLGECAWLKSTIRQLIGDAMNALIALFM